MYKGLVKSPILKSPEKIIVHTIPEITKKVKPYIEIVSGKDFSVVKLHLELTQEFRFGQIRNALT